MDHPRGVLLEGEALKQQIVLVGRDVRLDVDEAIADPVALEDVGVWLLADLALKLLPGVADQILFLFFDHFLLQPMLEALVVDEPDRAVAHAAVEERVLACGRVFPADLALHVVLGGVDDAAVDLDRLFLELLAQAVLRLLLDRRDVADEAGVVVTAVAAALLRAGELLGLGDRPRADNMLVVLHVELDAAELDDITAAKLIVL